jgi:CRP-like cAMP-binding protein
MTYNLTPDPKQLSRLEVIFAKSCHFDNLPRNVLENIAVIASPRHFDAGQVIYIEGEPADVFYMLERGWIKATRMSRDGREQALLFLEAGEVFGDIAVFSGTTYSSTVTALEGVDVWTIPSRELVALTEQSSALAMAIIHHLSDRVLHYIGMVEDLSLRNVESRLAITLLQHAEAKDGQLLVPRRQWTTFDEMAVRLGTVRDVLSRALKTLEAEGLIRVEKQAIVVLNPKGLAEHDNL